MGISAGSSSLSFPWRPESQKHHLEAPQPTAGPEPALCFPSLTPHSPNLLPHRFLGSCLYKLESSGRPLWRVRVSSGSDLPLMWELLELQPEKPRASSAQIDPQVCRHLNHLPTEGETDIPRPYIPRLSFSPLWQSPFPDPQLSSTAQTKTTLPRLPSSQW